MNEQCKRNILSADAPPLTFFLADLTFDLGRPAAL